MSKRTRCRPGHCDPTKERRRRQERTTERDPYNSDPWNGKGGRVRRAFMRPPSQMELPKWRRDELGLLHRDDPDLE